MTAGDRWLLVRADAGPKIGVGHVARCLALAQAWQDAGGKAIFLCRELPSRLAERLAEEDIEYDVNADHGQDPPETSKIIRRARELDAVVVLDGYQFKRRYQQELHEAVPKLLVLDDHGEIGEYCADVILDQNLGAREECYRRRNRRCQLLLGHSFILLRREFRTSARERRSTKTVAQNLLVSFGGSDRGRVTTRIIEAMRQSPRFDLSVRVVAAAGDPNLPELRELAGRVNWIRLEYAVDNMARVMEWADLAITAGGSICWELAYLGVPSILITIAGNQEPIARRLADHGAAVALGRAKDVEAQAITDAVRTIADDQDRRREMSRKGRQLVDGLGAERVVQAILG
jgi:UDP-2,4-diacetamido-2,4,6-trideoxy-beta-L-altropyranose hydrolase